jgi:hypothetical protein
MGIDLYLQSDEIGRLAERTPLTQREAAFFLTKSRSAIKDMLLEISKF